MSGKLTSGAFLDDNKIEAVGLPVIAGTAWLGGSG